jgi:phytoene dehydrogenase-like protein
VLELMTVVPAKYAYWGATTGPGAGEKYRRLDHYQERKDQITQGLIAKAEELIPGIKDHITYIEAASPLTQERYTLSSDGSCYAAEFNSFQFGPLRPQPKTEIPGLFLTGANTRYCHGVMATMVGGVGTAAAVLGRDLLTEIRRGAVYGDPSLLTAGGPGWDPLTASQKHAKRDNERRAEAEAAAVASL